jgi:aminoglycoside 3-N-acetyltransferase
MSLTCNDLIRDFKTLGIQSGDLLLVHSSLSTLGWVEGGAETVIRALLETLGPEGTLAVPTLTGSEQDGPNSPPQFDARETPCWTGRIPETLRDWKDAHRSAHPTHSVAAVGAKAKALTEGHEDAETPCGLNSPYDKLVSGGGKILLLGVDHRCNTAFHHIEELAQRPYHLQAVPTLVNFKDETGRCLTRTMRLHAWGTPRDFNRVETDLISAGAEAVGKVGQATARLLDAGKMVRTVLAGMVSDPNILLAAGHSPDSEAKRRTIRIDPMDHAKGLPLPDYATLGSVGMDLHAAVSDPMILPPGEWTKVPTGLKVAIPHGYEAQIRPRSGLAAKKGITCLNSPGTIDSDFRGELQIILINHSREPLEIKRGDRIAQMVIAEVVLADWEVGPVEEDTERGAGGFGHTGVSSAK